MKFFFCYLCGRKRFIRKNDYGIVVLIEQVEVVLGNENLVGLNQKIYEEMYYK